MQVTMIRDAAEHAYVTVFLDGEMQHYRVHHQSGLVQRRFGLRETPHWARVHPDRAGAIHMALGSKNVA